MSKVLTASIFMLTTIFLTSCGNNSVKSNYDKIKINMSRQETESILGPPSNDLNGRIIADDEVKYDSDEKASVLTWKYGGEVYILVNIENDKVIAKTKQGF